jgi:hypothetical protein
MSIAEPRVVEPLPAPGSTEVRASTPPPPAPECQELDNASQAGPEAPVPAAASPFRWDAPAPGAADGALSLVAAEILHALLKIRRLEARVLEAEGHLLYRLRYYGYQRLGYACFGDMVTERGGRRSTSNGRRGRRAGSFGGRWCF